MKKIITGLMILASTQFALATSTSVTKIKDIYVYADFIVMKMDNTHTNIGCTKATANEFLYLPTNSDGGKKMYSAVLSAYVSGQKIKLGYATCRNWGSTTIPEAYGMVLTK